MRVKHWTSIVVATLSFGVVGTDAMSMGRLTVRFENSVRGHSAVVVELFTSEECSSCPPADAVLSELVRTQPITGAEVIALSEHVDYWNHIGWTDPYSSPFFSDRQAGYVRSMRLQGSYTPQMVVDGYEEFVGSDRERASEAITASSGRRKAVVELSLVPGKVDRPNLTVEISNANAASDVWIAVTEDDLQSSVTRGENSGRRLVHTGVVRILRKVGTTQKGDIFHQTFPITIHDEWKKKDLRIVAFVQESGQKRILGAASVRPF